MGTFFLNLAFFASWKFILVSLADLNLPPLFNGMAQPVLQWQKNNSKEIFR